MAATEVTATLGSRTADNVTVSGTSGIDPCTLTLNASVPATTLVGDRFIQGGASWLIRSKGTDTLTVSRFPYDNTGTPATGAGTTERAFANVTDWNAAYGVQVDLRETFEGNADGLIWTGEIVEGLVITTVVSFTNTTASAGPNNYKKLRGHASTAWNGDTWERGTSPFFSIGSTASIQLGAGGTFTVAAHYGRLEDLRIITSAGVNQVLTAGTSSVYGIQVRRCVIRSTYTGAHPNARLVQLSLATAGQGLVFANNLIIDSTGNTGNYGINIDNTLGTVRVAGCTIVKPASLTNASNAINRQNGGTKDIVSTAVFGYNNCISGTGGTLSGDYNATDDTTFGVGANSIANVPFDSTTFVDEDTDFSVIPGCQLDGAGQLHSNLNGEDATRYTRADPPTTGAYEISPVGITRVDETDSITANFGSDKLQDISQVTSTEIAQAFNSPVTITIGQVVETEVAQLFDNLKSVTIGQATETEELQTFGRLKFKAIGSTIEINAAQAFMAFKGYGIGQVTETEIAQPFTLAGGPIVVAIEQALEEGAAQAFGKDKVTALSAAPEETDSVPDPFTFFKVKDIIQVTESDIAFKMSIIGGTIPGHDVLFFPGSGGPDVTEHQGISRPLLTLTPAGSGYDVETTHPVSGPEVSDERHLVDGELP